ncbi:hypothetical protein C7H19_13405 [Aphanothece hegewaldii CCALA 016]|uniref:Uncharacterized protein n=1 Tax=Aphanothece hegewaldii CCALA 016 TaxID=2107694 RepID=A0A2T1LWZ2_9CHRO|nr:hypothetical protein [Aphanothece hegewaldii]PSF36667.1 hypothetical protein C7H19_13405 [Aphanothece hegewaldii CCALA 016]
MTSTTQELLKFFEQLPELEQQEVVVEILRRTLNKDLPILTDEELVLNAEELFLSLEQSESENN